MFNILYVTGSRAEYGIMKNLLFKLHHDDKTNLDIVITGTHLDERYGMTGNEIIESGLNVVAQIKTINSGLDQDIVASLATITHELVDVYSAKNYDLTLILGDRQEMLAVANAAVLFKSPIAHFHGGEVTEGNYDDYIRHALTKLSHLHFTSCEPYRKRVIQMGERPESVFNIGSMAVDGIRNLDFTPFAVLAKETKVPFDIKDYSVVLYHPVTLNGEKETLKELDEFVDALLLSKQNYVLIGSNADVYSNHIQARFKELQSHNASFYGLKSLDHHTYTSLVKHSKGLIGNSSSGIIEVASLGVAVLNVGDRQKGRIHSESVIDCRPVKAEIIEGIRRMSQVANFDNPYDKADSVNEAHRCIINYLTHEHSLRKIFYDMECIYED